MSRARDLSKLGNPNIIKADTTSVGFGTQIAGNPANAASSLISAGIVTAAQFFGDGSNLEGVASAGLGTAVDDTKDSIGQNIYYTNDELSIYENTTVNAPSTSDVAYTQYAQVTVESGKELIIADGDTFIPDVLGIGTGLQANAGGAGNGLFGTVYADNIENVAGRGGPNFPLGMTVSGIATFSGNVSIGGTLTYEDVTNVDSIGVVTARNGIDVTAGGLDITAGGITVGGVSTLNGNLNIAGNAQFTVGSPQLEFNNGGPRLWSPSANTLTIHTGGGFGSSSNERLRIGSGGQIGIGGANYGSSGQVLTSQGNAAAPQWAEAGGGAWEIVNDISMAADYGSSEIDITGFTTAYTQYRVNMNNLCFVGDVTRKLYIRWYLDGVLLSATNSYAYHNQRNQINGAGSYPGGTYNQSAWQLQNNNPHKGWSGDIHVTMRMNPTTNTLSPRATIQNVVTDEYYGSDACKSAVSGAGKQITGLKIYNGTDTVNFGLSGRVTTYGLKYS